MADNDYSLSASVHQIMFQPAPPDNTSDYTLRDVISGKAILNLDNRQICFCGFVFELPEPIVEMAVRLAQTLPLDTPMIYGISHPWGDEIPGETEEEIVAQLREWYDKHDNLNGTIRVVGRMVRKTD